MRARSTLTLALTVVGAVSMVSSVTAMAQQTPQNPQAPQQSPSSPAPANQIDSSRTPPNDKSLTEFWTPERLREARPMPMPRVEPNDVKK